MDNLPNIETATISGFLSGLFGASIVALIIFSLILYILVVIANWKIFVKAKEKGWKALIPFYNLYIIFKIFWRTSWFWCVVIATVAVGFAEGILGVNNNIVVWINLAFYLFMLVVSVILYNRMAKSFGHGTGYTIGLIFLPNIFTLILGFNKDKYKKLKD